MKLFMTSGRVVRNFDIYWSFESLWPAKEFQGILKPLKALQEDLGQFNDCSVQQESLKNFGDMLGKQQPVPAQTLVTMGMLVSTEPTAG